MRLKSLRSTLSLMVSAIIVASLCMSFYAAPALAGDEDFVAQDTATEQLTTNDNDNITLDDPVADSEVVPGDASEDEAEVPAEPVVQKPEKKPTEAGWMQDTDGTWYYFTNANADPSVGWIQSGAYWYWLSPEDNGAMVHDQWITNNNKRYYLTDEGPGQMATGWFQVDGDWYYADNSGAVKQHGWIKSGNRWYWLLAEENGKMAIDQWINDKNDRYYLTDKGPGQMATGWFQVDGDWYYADGNGAQQNGWMKAGKNWYWLQADQNGKMAQNQWITDKGKRYFLTDKGPGQMATGWFQVDGDWYYADGNGAQQTGWLSKGGKWYWLQADQNGLMFANGTKEINGVTYSFDGNGAMAASSLVDLGDGIARYAASSGAMIPIGIYKDGKVILTQNNGEPVSGWIYKEAVKKWFYSEPGTGIMQTGWVQTGGKWYWMDSAGAMATNTWVDGGKYFVGSDGAWVQVNIIQDIRPSLSHGTKTAQYQKYIVIHDTEGGGTPQNVVNWWISDGRYVAAHFVIGKDGTIVQCVPMDQIAHHAGWGTSGNNAKFGVTDESRDDKRGQQPSSWSNDYGMNSYSIGIELVHNGSTHEAYPKAQLEALDKLIAYIDGYYGKQSTIIDHKMWRTGNSDTSKEFAGYLANYRDHRSYK